MAPGETPLPTPSPPQPASDTDFLQTSASILVRTSCPDSQAQSPASCTPPPAPTAAALGTATHRLFCLDTDFPWHGRKAEILVPNPTHHLLGTALSASPSPSPAGTSCVRPQPPAKQAPSSLSRWCQLHVPGYADENETGLGVRARGAWGAERTHTVMPIQTLGVMLVRVWSCL